MPLSRYQIRNEYSLADPELYKVADKDDPEALLEGVAMAGLVGVLRQLGDLAEFAAEIFHDLHEEVMATSARGHGLIVRVQQLEAEFPLVERTLLSQTSHTAFLYNSGIDWHPNARMDENVVTRGDLPRFVMDSYEECRGPPRLFLLDKFDVAGAGACLKRFTDPSFFKAEAAASTGKKLDNLREKRARRVKKRGPRWRNEATPENYQSSHAKLHQLFLEELIETGGNDPDRRVKLKKRQFTGSLFDKEKRKSYMEKILDSCSHEQKIVHEVCIDALPLPWTSDNGCETSLEIVEIGTNSPLKESIHSSPDIREVVVKSSLEIFSEGRLNDTREVTIQNRRLSHDSDDGKISSASSKIRSEETFADRHSRSEVSDGDSSNSDDVASEIDNYMDALGTMESEVESDSECNNNRRYLYLKSIVVDSDLSEGLREPHGSFLDSQSVGNSTASEDGNNFFKERHGSSRSISVKSLAESTLYLDEAVKAVSSVPVCNSDADNVSSEYYSTSEHVSKSKTGKCTVGGAPVEADETSKTAQERGDACNCSYLAGPNDSIRSVDMVGTMRRNSLPNSDLDELCSNSAEPEILSGMGNPRHANQTNNSFSVRTVFGTCQRTDSGHNFNAQQSMHDFASHSSSVCAESLLDPETTHDVMPQIEHKKADSAGSVEEHSNDFGIEDETSICDPNVQEMVKAIDGASNLDFCITSLEENSDDDQYSRADPRWKFNQELSAETNSSHPPLPDYASAAASLASSLKDFLTEEVSANDESEEKVLSARIVGQTENFPLSISSGLLTCASQSSFSGTTDAAETAEHGSLEAIIDGEVSSGGESNGRLLSASANGEIMGRLTIMEKPSPVLDPTEEQRLPSEIAAALLKHHHAETGNQPGEETSQLQNFVSTGGDEYRAVLDVVAFDRDVCEDVTSVYSNLPDPVETVEHLDKSESWAVEDNTTSGHDLGNLHDDKDEADKFLFDEPSMLPTRSSSISAPEIDSSQLHDMESLEHKKTGSDGSRQVDVEDYPHGNLLLPSSSSLCLENVEEPFSVTDCNQNGEESTICPSIEPIVQERIDPVHDAPINLHYNACSITSDEYPDLISFNSSFAEDVQNSVNFDVTEAPLTSESGHQDLDSNFSQKVDLPDGMEDNMGSYSLQFSETVIPQEKGLELHDDEPQGKPLLAKQQIQAPDYVSREENSASLHVYDQPSIPQLPPVQPAVHLLEGFTQPMVEPTSFLAGNNLLTGTNQAAQLVENLGQPTQTPGFPVYAMLQVEPQIKLDSPPLPPLPPIQWRLSRFQSSSAAMERQTAQHIYAPVQPITLPDNGNETDPFSHTINGLGQPEYSNDGEERAVNMQLLLVPDSEVSLENNMNGTQGENLSVTNSTSTMSLNGTQISEESYQPSANFVEPKSLANHASVNESLGMEAKVDAVNDQNEQPAHITLVAEQEAVNSHVPFLPSSPVHSDWQPPPGLMAPEERRTWLSAYDRLPTDEGVYANEVLQKKPPRPRNPLIDEVVAIDKSKLRKVERIKPSMESKLERGEFFLEQLQLRKVERVKPPIESKAQEGESLLEHLQLRKVSEKAKPPLEPKFEEEEFSLPQLQLRKVEESVKPQTESKTERELPLEHIQLRKVGERVKSEAEQRPEETESPRVQLRKVSERVKQDFQQKPEETGSPRVQLRNFSEKVKQEVQEKPEETESPRVQLRKVGQIATSSVVPKTEERDSILEQIRNKSFRLKPAVAARPNIQGIQGPRTNLKVAAIIEKASTIRQAMAGSDEEDDADNWSDD